jgi:dihydropteroate synthase
LKLRARQFEFSFPAPVLVMGIVNVTPDSFSDGGQFLDPDAATAHAVKLAELGAGMIDIGGESTRPGAHPVAEAEELRRVLPVLERLAGRLAVPLSIDTMKPAVARAALQAGASVVNDVAANRQDPAMWQLVAEAGAAYVCVHMQGTPLTMQSHPTYSDVVEEVGEFFRERLKSLGAAGVNPDQVILDPGIGFGKTVEHNLQLLAGMGGLARLGRPLLLGVSRKSFLGKVAGQAPAARLSAALACACLGVPAGVQILRAHDVAETLAAVRMTETVLARQGTADPGAGAGVG